MPQAVIPGQTLHIQHQLNKNHPINSSVRPISRPLADIVGDNWGNDFEAPAGVGYKWLSVPDDPAYWEPSDPASPNFPYNIKKIPPGFVFGFKHSETVANKGLLVGGFDAVNKADMNAPGPVGMLRQHGGDLGTGEHKGYYWFVTTSQFFNKDEDWKNLQSTLYTMPVGSILGLKHSINQPDSNIRWRVFENVYYGKTVIQQFVDHYINPQYEGAYVPKGFQRVFGGDFESAATEGYWWLEKVDSTFPPIPSVPEPVPPPGPNGPCNCQLMGAVIRTENFPLLAPGVNVNYDCYNAIGINVARREIILIRNPESSTRSIDLILCRNGSCNDMDVKRLAPGESICRDDWCKEKLVPGGKPVPLCGCGDEHVDILVKKTSDPWLNPSVDIMYCRVFQ